MIDDRYEPGDIYYGCGTVFWVMQSMIMLIYYNGSGEILEAWCDNSHSNSIYLHRTCVESLLFDVRSAE